MDLISKTTTLTSIVLLIFTLLHEKRLTAKNKRTCEHFARERL